MQEQMAKTQAELEQKTVEVSAGGGKVKVTANGAGDIIARTIGPIGGDAFKKWYKTIFNRDCGCGKRQETLNARWPL